MLVSLHASVLGVLAAAATSAAAGDPAIGRALFIGERPLAAGGAPCGACHAVGGQGMAFAASFGPDLSQSFDEPQAADTILEGLPFPSMTPVYAGRPLTPAERGHLAAFLIQPGRTPAGEDRRIAAWVALVAAAAVAVLAIAALRRPGSVRARLLARSRGSEGGVR